jgi:hypothetical protein
MSQIQIFRRMTLSEMTLSILGSFASLSVNDILYLNQGTLSLFKRLGFLPLLIRPLGLCTLALKLGILATFVKTFCFNYYHVRYFSHFGFRIQQLGSTPFKGHHFGSKTSQTTWYGFWIWFLQSGSTIIFYYLYLCFVLIKLLRN